MEPCISVIIPMYKVENYIRRCLDSVIHQTYQNLEIIIIDDGSPDACGAIAEEYRAKDSRIKVIHQQNQGISVVRNVGVAAATGEWICFVDSDDEIPLHGISQLWELADKEQVQMSMGGYYVCINKGNRIKKKQIHVHENVIRDTKSMQRYFLSKGKNFNYLWMKLYHKSVFTDIRFQEGRYYEDIMIFSDIIEAAGSVAIVDEPIYYYHLRETSITYGSKIQNHMDGLLARLQWRDFIEKKYPDLLPYSQDAILEFCCYLLGKVNLHGRKANISYWNEIKECYQKYEKTAAKETLYLRIAVLVFRVSPTLLGKLCCLYSKIKNL